MSGKGGNYTSPSSRPDKRSSPQTESSSKSDQQEETDSDDIPSSSYSAQLVLAKLEGISTDIGEINKNISELRESIDFCHAQYTIQGWRCCRKAVTTGTYGDIDALRQEIQSWNKD